MSKLNKFKAKMAAMRAPAEAAPIVVLLKQKKKEGVDVQPIVDSMLAVAGG